MEKTILSYRSGDSLAKERLIDHILELHKYNISRDEAMLLLHKKYGTAEKF